MNPSLLRFSLTAALLILGAGYSAVVAAQPPNTSRPADDDPQLLQRNRLSQECERLRAAGDWPTAIIAAEKMLALEQRILPADAEDIRGTWIFLGEVAERAEEWQRAETYRLALVEWCVRHRGEKHWHTLEARADQADLRRNAALSKADRDALRASRLLGNEMIQLYGEGKIAAAIGKADEARSICGRLLGEENREYAVCLGNLALLYAALPDAAQAEAAHRRAVEVLTAALGDAHPQVATALNNWAGFYNRNRRYAEAESLYRRALEIRKSTLGERHVDYAVSLNDLATLYDRLFDYAQAESLLLQAVEAYRAAVGERHPEFAKCVNNLASLYDTLGDYARAEPLYLQGLDVLKAAYGEKHPRYASALNAVAVFYQKTGDYVRAEPLLRQVLALRKEILGEQHPDYAAALGNLAGLFREMQDYARAEPLYLQAIAIEQQTLGENDANRAITLNNLAFVYDGLKDYAKSEPLYRQALAIQQAALGEKHPSYATTLNNLAEHYRVRGDYARAEPLIRRATELTKQSLGEKHPSYARRLNNLAGLLHGMGRDDQAEPLYREAIDIFRDALGDEHADYATALHNLGFFYAALGRNDEAAPLFRRSLEITRQLLDTAALIQSERQQLLLGKELRHRLDAYLSLGLDAGTDAAPIFSEVLRWKGAVLVRQRAMRLAAGDPHVAELFERLQRATREVAAVSRTMPADAQARGAWNRRVAELTAAKELLEAELSRRTDDERSITQTVAASELTAALPADVVLVDFLEFRRHTSAGKRAAKPTFERQWVAFLVRPAEKPDERIRLLSLGPAAPVVRAVDEWRESHGQSAAAAAAGNLLRKTLWEPLLPHLADAKTILISTDGALGRLPFVALPGKAPGTYLLEDHRLAMVPVPQLIPSLLKPGKRREPPKELLLIGDVDYDSAGPAAVATAPKKKVPRRPGETRGGEAFAHFGPLEYTKAEIDALRELYGELYDATPDDPFSLTKSSATEAEFRRLAPDFRHVHVATHGFFAPPQNATTDSAEAEGPSDFFRAASRNAQIVGFTPGLLSGLALAGANLQPHESDDDGVLTSLEISTLPLGSVDLVVLSACETGLGAVAGGEGLLGVQRAFQVAGVGTTVAGLWKVDDLQTMALMKRFYHNLWKKEFSRLDALREAQLWMLREGPRRDLRLKPQPGVKPDESVRSPPFHWAPFVLSGDWR